MFNRSAHADLLCPTVVDQQRHLPVNNSARTVRQFLEISKEGENDFVHFFRLEAGVVIQMQLNEAQLLFSWEGSNVTNMKPYWS